jgi:hypothetical protein
LSVWSKFRSSSSHNAVLGLEIATADPESRIVLLIKLLWLESILDAVELKNIIATGSVLKLRSRPDGALGCCWFVENVHKGSDDSIGQFMCEWQIANGK